MTHAWQRRQLGMYWAVTAEGHVAAQVAQIVGAGGTDQGWIVSLAHTPGELLGRYRTAEAAMTAVDSALTAS
jgi:hypothetical protein